MSYVCIIHNCCSVIAWSIPSLVSAITRDLYIVSHMLQLVQTQLYHRHLCRRIQPGTVILRTSTCKMHLAPGRSADRPIRDCASVVLCSSSLSLKQHGQATGQAAPQLGEFRRLPWFALRVDLATRPIAVSQSQPRSLASPQCI